jgi:hypothetical protein
MPRYCFLQLACKKGALMSAVAPSAVELRPLRPATADSVSAAAPDPAVKRFDKPPQARIAPPGQADPEPGPSDDSWRLMVLLAVFVAAPLVVVAAVWAVAAIGTLWALVFALGVDLVVTVFVCATVAFVLSGGVPLGGRDHHAG